MGVGIVLLVGAALLSADTVLVGEEAGLTIAVVGVAVVLRVDGAGHTVSAAHEVVDGASLA